MGAARRSEGLEVSALRVLFSSARLIPVPVQPGTNHRGHARIAETSPTSCNRAPGFCEL